MIMNQMPMVITNVKGADRAFDLSSLLHNKRVIFISQEFNDHLSNVIVQQLLHLDSENNDDIDLYINSGGGSVTSGLAIFDTIKFIKSKVNTYCVGQCASMGAFILSAGTGKRSALANSRIMIHQPLGGAGGQATDMVIQTEEIIRLKEKLTRELAKACGRSYEEVYNICERDHFMSAEQAKEFGVVDEVVEPTHK